MNEIIPVKTPVKRRRFSKAFKARIVAACDQPDASVAGVALANGLNANLVHRWRRLNIDKVMPVDEHPAFLPVVTHSPAIGHAPGSVVIEVNGAKLHWPLSHIDQSIAWLRALQA